MSWRFIHEHDSEDRLTSVIAGHLLPSQSRLELPGPTDSPLHHQPDTSMPGPSCSLWRETLREWLIDCETFKVVPHIEFLWEDPDSSNPGKSWAALLDLFRALQGNVTNWIRKIDRNGVNMLAAHGEDVFRSEGVKASIRAELRLDLKVEIPAKKWGDTEIAERGRSVLVMRARYRSAGLTPHQRGWTDAG